MLDIYSNIEKLLLILEYLLQNGAMFVTSNYLLANGHVERRKKLVKANSRETMGQNWRNLAGLAPLHKYFLSNAPN